MKGSLPMTGLLTRIFDIILPVQTVEPEANELLESAKEEIEKHRAAKQVLSDKVGTGYYLGDAVLDRERGVRRKDNGAT